MVERIDEQFIPVSAYRPQEIYHKEPPKKTLFSTRKVIVKKEDSETSLKAVPLRILSDILHSVRDQTSKEMIVFVSGIGFVSSTIFNALAKATRMATNVAKEQELAKSLATSAQILSSQTINQSMQVRQQRQQLIDLIPIANTLGKIEERAEHTALFFGKNYLLFLLELAKHTTPTILGAINKVASGTEAATGWIKDVLYTSMTQPHIVHDFLIKSSDRIDALFWDMTHETITVKETEVTQKKQPVPTSTLSLIDFQKLSKREQLDILFLVQNAQNSDWLDQEKNFLSLYSGKKNKVLSFDEDLKLREALAQYNTLSRDQKNKITPQKIASLDTLEKIKLFHIIRSYAKNLSKKEHYYLSHFRNIRYREDFLKLSEEDKTLLETIVASKWNTLKEKHKEKAKNISIEQFYSFNKELQNELLEKAKKALCQDDIRPIDKKIVSTMISSDSPFQWLQVEALLRVVNPILSSEEKALYLHASQTFVWRTHIDYAIESKKSCIDKDEIQKKIHHAIVTSGPLHHAGKTMGNYTKQALEKSGNIGNSFWSLLKTSSLPHWTNFVLNKTASSLEILLLLPFAKVGLAHILESYGVPIYAIEETVARLPAQMLHAASGINDTLLQTAHGVKQYVDHWSKMLSTTKEHLDRVQNLDTLQASGKVLEESTLNEMASFTNSIQQTCVELTQAQQLLCSQEAYNVLQSKETLFAYAGKVGLEPTSHEFLSLIKQIATTGKVPLASEVILNTITTPIENTLFHTVSASVDPIRQATERQADGWIQWFLEGVQATRKNLEGSLDTINQQATILSNSVKTRLGIYQEMPKEVATAFENLTQSAGKLAANKAATAATLASQQALEEMQGIFGNAMKTLAHNEPLVTFVKESWNDSISPTLQTMLNSMDTLHTVNQKNASFLEHQIQTNLVANFHIQQFLDAKAKTAQEVLDNQDASKMRQLLFKTASYGLPVLGWLLCGTSNIIVLPFIAQKILPHVLRAIAPHTKTLPHFWELLGKTSSDMGSFFGTQLENGLQSGFNILQKNYNLFQEQIDPERIKNFEELSFDEQQHIFSVLLEAKSISEKERTDFKQHIEVLVSQASKRQKRVSIEHTLKLFDRLTDEERLVLSSSYFTSLPERKRQKIVDIILRYEGYNPHEPMTPESIVKRFNALSPEQKKTLEQLDIHEFLELSDVEQEDILFTLAHNSNTLEEEKSLSEAYSNTTDTLYGLGDEEKNTTRDVSQIFDTFLSLEKASLRKKEQILEHFYPKQIPPLVYPSIIRNMSREKIEHLFSIIMRYHPEFIEEFQKNTKTALNPLRITKYFENPPASPMEEKEYKLLTYAIASLFNQLPLAEQKELLLMKTNEFFALGVKQQKELIYLILSEQSEDHPLLQECLKRTTITEEDCSKITFLFNQLPSEVQAEFRKFQEVDHTKKKAIHDETRKKMCELDTKITTIRQRIATLSDTEFLAHKARLGVQKSERQNLIKEEKTKENKVLFLKTSLEGQKQQGLIDQNLLKEKQNIERALEGIREKKETLALEINKTREKKQFVVQKIKQLMTLEKVWVEEYTALSSFLEEKSNLKIAQEHPQLLQSIDDILETALGQVFLQLKTAFTAKYQKGKTVEEIRKHLEDVQEIVTTLIDTAKERILSIQTHIKDLSEQIENHKQNDEIEPYIQKLLELRALSNITLRSNKKILKKYTKLQEHITEESSLFIGSFNRKKPSEKVLQS